MPFYRTGHTPGHSSYKVSDKEESIVFWGDLMHSVPVQFAQSDVTILFDVNPKEAALARKELLQKQQKTITGLPVIIFPFLE